MKNKEVAGVVVIYNTSLENLNNVATYISQVKRLYVVDNSDLFQENLINYLRSLHSVVYIPNIGNPGIAHALNIAANQAIKDNFSYLLTMDDDSQSPSNMISTMLSFIDDYTEPEKIGIISVAHSTSPFSLPFKEVGITMTSGNLLNLYAYQKVGPFNEELFIDHVDHEYNLRLHLNEFKIIELANLKLKHKLGATKQFTFYKLHITYISHNPMRIYYFVRNAIYISRKYISMQPKICLNLLLLMMKEIIKSFFLEDQKRLRLLYIWKAIIAGWQGHLGKLRDLYGN